MYCFLFNVTCSDAIFQDRFLDVFVSEQHVIAKDRLSCLAYGDDDAECLLLFSSILSRALEVADCWKVENSLKNDTRRMQL